MMPFPLSLKDRTLLLNHKELMSFPLETFIVAMNNPKVQEGRKPSAGIGTSRRRK